MTPVSCVDGAIHIEFNWLMIWQVVFMIFFIFLLCYSLNQLCRVPNGIEMNKVDTKILLNYTGVADGVSSDSIHNSGIKVYIAAVSDWEVFYSYGTVYAILPSALQLTDTNYWKKLLKNPNFIHAFIMAKYRHKELKFDILFALYGIIMVSLAPGPTTYGTIVTVIMLMLSGSFPFDVYQFKQLQSAICDHYDADAKELSKELSKDVSKDVSKEVSKELSQDVYVTPKPVTPPSVEVTAVPSAN